MCKSKTKQLVLLDSFVKQRRQLTWQIRLYRPKAATTLTHNPKSGWKGAFKGCPDPRSRRCSWCGGACVTRITAIGPFRPTRGRSFFYDDFATNALCSYRVSGKQQGSDVCNKNRGLHVCTHRHALITWSREGPLCLCSQSCTLTDAEMWAAGCNVAFQVCFCISWWKCESQKHSMNSSVLFFLRRISTFLHVYVWRVFILLHAETTGAPPRPFSFNSARFISSCFSLRFGNK